MAKKIVRGTKGLHVRKERAATWTQAKREAFLSHLVGTCNIAASCRAVNMSEQGFYKLRRRDPEFRRAFDEVIVDAYTRLELAQLDRHINGTRKPVFHGGKQVGEIVEYSERTAVALLAAHQKNVERAREAERRRESDPELNRLRLEAKLSEMNRRMGGNG